MKLSRRDLIMLMITSWIIMGFLFYQFLYLPASKEINQLERVNSELGQYANKAHDINQISSRKMTLQDEYQKLLIRIPEKEFLPELFSFYNQEASRTGITILSSSFGKSDQQAADDMLIADGKAANTSDDVSYQELPMSLEVQGDYYQLKRFILGIEQSHRLVSVKKASIAAEQKEITSLNTTVDPQMGEIIQTAPQPKASAAYDTNNLVMKLDISAYYNDKSLEGISGVTDLVAPPAAVKEYPFKH